MSVSYNRVNWADYPATTTPVNATNLNKMDKGIADLTSEVNSVESSVSNLNSSLDDIDIRYTPANGAEWSPRGADTWRPFSGSIKGIALICGMNDVGYNETYMSNGYNILMNTDGSLYSQQVIARTTTRASGINFIVQNSDIVSNMVRNSSYYANITLAKSGYYIHCESGGYPQIEHHDAGTTLTQVCYDNTYLLYLGDTNPFE